MRCFVYRDIFYVFVWAFEQPILEPSNAQKYAALTIPSVLAMGYVSLQRRSRCPPCRHFPFRGSIVSSKRIRSKGILISLLSSIDYCYKLPNLYITDVRRNGGKTL
jgi:hypothetical protein